MKHTDEQTREELTDWMVGEGLGEAICIDGPEFDAAIIGIDFEGVRLVYSYDAIAEVLMENSEPHMSYEEAAEYIDFNIINSLPGLGPHAPIIVSHVDS